ncbi:MAG: DUF4224 domain-containing protein [Burkholderiales bacterium]
MSILLNPDELAELTGTKRSCLQVEWLNRQGWRYVLSRNGAPRVSREYFSLRLGHGAERQESQSRPDWSRWNAKGANA